MSGRQSLGGMSASPSAYGADSTHADWKLPAQSILTPDDPPSRDDMAPDTFAAIAFGIGAFCIVGGLIYLATS